MWIYILLFVCSLLLTCDYFRRKRQRYQHLPPGPRGLPILGNVLQLGFSPHLTLSKWAQKFGPLYTCDVLGNPALILNDCKRMREILGDMKSTGKYKLILVDIIHGEKHGLANSEGVVWYEQHRFFVKTLKQFGFHRGHQLNAMVQQECTDMCNYIDQQLKENANSIYFNKPILQSLINIVWNVIAGEQHRKEDNHIVELVGKLFELVNKASVLIFMPWLSRIAPNLSGYKNLLAASEELHNEVRNQFAKHKLNRQLKQDTFIPGNTIDAYLEQIENCKDPNSTFYGEDGLKHSFYAVISFLVAGSETTASTLNWLIHFLVANPNVQKKLQNEVDDTLEENPDIIDKTRMPFLEAVVFEVLRMSSLLPLGVIHKLLDDFTYDGVTLPKGMYLLANIYHANNDPKVWRDPECFRPERFLEGSRAERKRLRESVVTFQEGRRKCPGEHMAKDMLYMFAYKLVAKYSFHPEENRTASEYLKPLTGFLLLPPKRGVVVKQRNV